MVVLPDRELVYVSVPKAGTHTMFDLLVKRFGGLLMSGPFHGKVPPGEFRAFLRFSVVRNPYTRAVSAWFHLTQREPYCGLWRQRVGGGDFERFTEYLAAGEFPPVRGNVVCFSQAEWLRDAGVRVVLHLERLAEELYCVGLGGVMVPHLFVAEGAYEPTWTAAAREAVQQWAREDFERYGYPTGS